MLLYRYRSINSAVRDLESCSFHFASKEELNDPLESYVCLFWQGDKPAWEGLLKNYICSLYHAISLWLLKGDKDILHKHTLVFNLQAYDEVPLGTVFDEISQRFLGVEQVQWLVTFYGNNNLKCGTKELILLLRMIHELAEKICIEDMLGRGTIESIEGKKILSLIGDAPEKLIEKLKKVGDENAEEQILKLDESKRRQLYADLENVMEDAIVQHMIIADEGVFKERDFLYKNEAEEKGDQIRNWLSIKSNYPKMYVEQLKEVIFPESYVVCFSSANDNSSMWGNYADNHKGVCLIYESDNLMVRHKQVYSDLDGNMVRPSEYSKIRVVPVEYGGNLVERNFFETLGRLTYSQVCVWLTGRDGKVSSILESYTNNKDSWREKYWQEAERKYRCKLDSWAHEREYRICIDNAFETYTDKESRNLEFLPESLKGVIFGINTSEYDMKRIIEAIPRECWAKDTDFNFYQAEYDDETMKIVIRKKIMFIGKKTE